MDGMGWTMIKNVLEFFSLEYSKQFIYINLNIYIEKVRFNFIWVLNFGQVGELSRGFSKLHCGDFFKTGSNHQNFPYEGNTVRNKVINKAQFKNLLVNFFSDHF